MQLLVLKSQVLRTALSQKNQSVRTQLVVGIFIENEGNGLEVTPRRMFLL
jgi:hypothetical protein